MVVVRRPSRHRSSFLIPGLIVAAIGCDTGLTAVPEPPVPSSIEIQPGAISLAPAERLLLSIVIQDDHGRRPAGSYVTWRTSSDAIATVDAQGWVTAHSSGTARITATHGELTATASLEVANTSAGATIATVAIAPGAHTLNAIGDTLELTAVALDANGDTVDGAIIDWSSPDPAVVSVTTTGRVISNAIGAALVIATSGGSADTVTVDARQIAAALELYPATASLDPGDTLRMSAVVRDSNGVAIPSPSVVWNSSTGDAIVDATGLVTAVSPGALSITAAAHGFAGSSALTIDGPPEVRTAIHLTSWRADDFVNSIGVNIHLSYFNGVYDTGLESIIKPKLKRLGIRHVRDGGRYYPDNQGWNKVVYGRYRDVAESTGVDFTVIASPAGQLDNANWSDFSHVGPLLDLIGRDNVDAFEGLNEHNQSGRSNWINEVRSLQKAVYQRVKSDPALSRYTVLGPSLTQAAAASAAGDLSAFMDFGAIHPYPGGNAPVSTQISDDVARYRPTNGNRQVWITETGYHMASQSANPWHTPVSERAMARYVMRLLLGAFDQGVPRTFLYELIDEGNDASNIEHNFGLLRRDGTEKMAFGALANLIGILDDGGKASFTPRAVELELVGDTAGISAMALEKADGRVYVALWRRVPSYQGSSRTDLTVAPKHTTLVLPAPRAVRVFVPLESRAALAQLGAVVRVPVEVADHPILVEIGR